MKIIITGFLSVTFLSLKSPHMQVQFSYPPFFGFCQASKSASLRLVSASSTDLFRRRRKSSLSNQSSSSSSSVSLVSNLTSGAGQWEGLWILKQGRASSYLGAQNAIKIIYLEAKMKKKFNVPRYSYRVAINDIFTV